MCFPTFLFGVFEAEAEDLHIFVQGPHFLHEKEKHFPQERHLEGFAEKIGDAPSNFPWVLESQGLDSVGDRDDERMAISVSVFELDFRKLYDHVQVNYNCTTRKISKISTSTTLAQGKYDQHQGINWKHLR